MKAYFGKKTIKQKYLTRMITHRKADQLIHGTYWENNKGCAIGCITHSSCHSKFETELGLPIWLAHLVDWLFENMPNGKAMTFPERVLEAIPVGAPLELTYSKFCIFLLKEICKNTDHLLVKNAIDRIIELHTKILTFKKTNIVTTDEWSAAWSAARSARSAA